MDGSHSEKQKSLGYYSSDYYIVVFSRVLYYEVSVDGSHSEKQ